MTATLPPATLLLQTAHRTARPTTHTFTASGFPTSTNMLRQAQASDPQSTHSTKIRNVHTRPLKTTLVQNDDPSTRPNTTEAPETVGRAHLWLRTSPCTRNALPYRPTRTSECPTAHLRHREQTSRRRIAKRLHVPYPESQDDDVRPSEPHLLNPDERPIAPDNDPRQKQTCAAGAQEE